MIQRTKIALIMPYFGNFPNYFALWECSASKNRDIDFFSFYFALWECSASKNRDIDFFSFYKLSKGEFIQKHHLYTMRVP